MTISREVGRDHRGDIYCSLTAEKKGLFRRSLPRHHRRQTYQSLVEDKLALDWSPEQISSMLPNKFPGDKRMQISPSGEGA